MTLSGCTALVTGANRGIGAALVRALLARGAARVYAAVRDPAAVRSDDADRVVVLPLDVTDGAAVTAAAARAPDVGLLINNAGVLTMGGFVTPAHAEAARREMEVNYFGTLAMARAFAPVLAANGGGVIVNILSVAALVNMPFIASYSASKAAALSLTQGLRGELAKHGTRVMGVFPGPVDTAMAAELPVDKATPDAVAAAVLDGVESGAEDVFPDAYARSLKEKLDADPKAVAAKFAARTSVG